MFNRPLVTNANSQCKRTLTFKMTMCDIDSGIANRYLSDVSTLSVLIQQDSSHFPGLFHIDS